MIKILLIDDHTIVRNGIRQMLEDVRDLQIVAEASTGAEGIQLTRERQPQVVILDFKLPDISGLEVTMRLLRIDPNLKILVVSSAINDLFPFRILEAGAKGYLTKNASKEELVHAIKSIYNGQRIIGPEIANRLALRKIDIKSKTNFNELTDREMEVFMMVIRCVPAQDIATRLFLSLRTVHSYRSRIFEKVKVENDVALTLLAIREGLITMEESTH